jgi:hypothetical protein
MLIDHDALVRHATAIKGQAEEVKALLENHRAELQKAKEHFMVRHKAATDKMTEDHRVLVEGISALQSELDEAIDKIAGQKPTAEKEAADVPQEG